MSSTHDYDYAKQPAVMAIVKLLARKRGATITEIQEARGYAPHSVRSVLSNLRRRAGYPITRERHPERGNVYRICVAGWMPPWERRGQKRGFTKQHAQRPGAQAAV